MPKSQKKYFLHRFLGFTVSEHIRGCIVCVQWEPVKVGGNYDITYENLFDIAEDLQGTLHFAELALELHKCIHWIPYKLEINLKKSKKMELANRLFTGMLLNYVDKINYGNLPMQPAIDHEAVNAASILLTMARN